MTNNGILFSTVDQISTNDSVEIEGRQSDKCDKHAVETAQNISTEPG